MRQSVAEFERAFLEHTHLDRERRIHLRQTAVKRTRVRRRDSRVQGQSRRFFLLVVVLIITVALVSMAMFETLAWLMA